MVGQAEALQLLGSHAVLQGTDSPVFLPASVGKAGLLGRLGWNGWPRLACLPSGLTQVAAYPLPDRLGRPWAGRFNAGTNRESSNYRHFKG